MDSSEVGNIPESVLGKDSGSKFKWEKCDMCKLDETFGCEEHKEEL